MAGQIESGVAKAAGIVGILVLICGIADCICGFIWIGYGGPGGHGLWSGFGVGLLLSLVSLVLPFCACMRLELLSPLVTSNTLRTVNSRNRMLLLL